MTRVANTGVHLESLAKVDVIVFDKTGTLTVGEPTVDGIHATDPTLTEETLLTLAAAADQRSGHPLAKAVVSRARQLNLDLPEPTAFEMVQGRGVKAIVANRAVLVGNKQLLEENGVSIAHENTEHEETSIYVTVDGSFVGWLEMADRIRPGAREVITRLKATGIKRVVMLTGDNSRIARRVATELGIDVVQAELLPEDKVNAILSLQKQGYRVAMVGDGVNDAPALACAEVGIAMGARGTQAALEAADIALMTDDLSKIVLTRAIAQRAYRTIKENIFAGVGVVHVLGITAGLLGIIGPIQAAVLHLGPDVLVFLNSVKLLRVRIET